MEEWAVIIITSLIGLFGIVIVAIIKYHPKNVENVPVTPACPLHCLDHSGIVSRITTLEREIEEYKQTKISIFESLGRLTDAVADLKVAIEGVRNYVSRQA